MRFGSLPVILILFRFASAESETQTDWSGGPGVYGPVIELGTEFHWDTDVSWLSVPGGMTLEHINRLPVAPGYQFPHSVTCGDIDSDGDEDVVAVQYAGSESVVWCENADGLGTQMILHVVGVAFNGAYDVMTGDINGDGHLDIVGASYGGDAIAWWRNNGSGTSWSMLPVYSSFDGAAAVFPADIDGDGDLDLLGAAHLADEIDWWENVNGLGTSWIRRTIDDNFDGAFDVQAGDIDGDGDCDVVGAAYAGSMVSWWENIDGGGTLWTKHTVSVGVTGASCSVVFDMNGDGDPDVLSTRRWGTGFSWWENDGGTPVGWTEHPVTSAAGGYIELYPADLDDDGDADIASVAMDADLVEWWENLDGSGTGWECHLVQDDYWSANSVWCDDLDADGHPDVVASSYFGYDISWWNLYEYSSTGSFESSFLDTQGAPTWDCIDWDASAPSGSTVGVSLRSASDPTSPGAWSDTLTAPGSISGVISDGDRYVQYAVIMTTPDPDTTPVLNEVTISWIQTGTGESAAPVPCGFLLQPFFPNPAHNPAVRFSLPEPSAASFSVYDVAGRLVLEVTGSEYPAGQSSVHLDGLVPGVYVCRMVSGDFTAARRFVVVE